MGRTVIIKVLMIIPHVTNLQFPTDEFFCLGEDQGPKGPKVSSLEF